MAYRTGSNWNDKNELKCLLIYKKLELEGFPCGRQADYCRGMEINIDLSVGNISAKVSNYKSVAKVNNDSNASKNTIRIYAEYGHLPVSEISSIIEEL